MNKLYTAQEVADRLKIKKTTVYELIKRGELESSKIGKQLRVSEEQLTQYLNRSSSGNSGSGQDIPYTSVNFEPESSLPVSYTHLGFRVVVYIDGKIDNDINTAMKCLIKNHWNDTDVA